MEQYAPFTIPHPQFILLYVMFTQSVGHLARKSGVLGSIPGLATYFRFSFRFSRRAVVSYWRKYVHEVLVNRLGGLSLPRKSVVRLKTISLIYFIVSEINILIKIR